MSETLYQSEDFINRLRDAFDEMVLFKDLKKSNFISSFKLPSFMRDWVIKRFQDEDGEIDADGATDFIREFIPKKEDWKSILNRVVNEHETVKFLGKISVNINIKNQTYLIDFYNAAIDIFNDKDEQLHITGLLQGIFMAEFSDYYINYSEMFLNNLGCNCNVIYYSNCVFGDVYHTLSIGRSAYLFSRSRKQFGINLEKEKEGYISKPIDIYFSVSLMSILFLLVCTGIDISSSKELIDSELSYIPGYNNAYGFFGKNINNVLDIMLFDDLNLEEEKLSDILVEYFPFMRWLSCESITVNACLLYTSPSPRD